MFPSRRTILTRSLAVPLRAAGVASLPTQSARAADTSTRTLTNGDF
ncbi:MAG: hypothetical protein QOI83_1687, partial [Streptomycetaceae bacterium]|nr:hypothetical protein [Streptomycetaceae bacterium]